MRRHIWRERLATVTLSFTLARLLSIGILAGVAIHVLGACSTSDAQGSAASEDAAADAVDALELVQPADAAAPTCKLTAKMTTGVATCDECLQKGCCMAFVACLSEAKCSALNACFNGCTVKFGQGDAGEQCVSACAQGKEEPTGRLTAALSCEATRCATQCR